MQPLHFNISKDLEEVYTEGDCWRLAEALHHMTHCPIVMLGHQNETHPDTEFDWWHMGVLIAPNMFLDITGIHDLHDLATSGTWGPDICDDPTIAKNMITQYRASVGTMYPDYDPNTDAQELLNLIDHLTENMAA